MSTEFAVPAEDRPDRLPETAVADLRCHSVPAMPEQVDQLRRQLATWAAEAGLPLGRTQDMMLAAYEAMANVVVHAYPDQPGTLDLDAIRHDDRITVTVTDRGQWQPAPVPGLLHGRGLPLIHTLADDAGFTTGPAGTVVEMTWTCAPML